MCGGRTSVVVEEKWTGAIDKYRLFDSELDQQRLQFFTVHLCSNSCARSQKAAMDNAGIGSPCTNVVWLAALRSTMHQYDGRFRFFFDSDVVIKE